MKAAPVVVLAMSPVLCAGLVRPAQLERLRRSATLPDPEPLGRFDEPRAEALLGQAEILLTGWGCPPLDAKLLARAPALRAVVHAAGTLKNHVTEACFERGLAISSAATANSLPVAEYTLAAILFANKRVFQLSRRYCELRAFRLWAAETPGLGNYRKRIGLVGASRVGRRLLALLAPFDFEVRVSDPTLSEEAASTLGAECCPLDELLPWCDLLSLHAPLLPSTQGLLDARRLALLRDGATLVNTARGGLVDAAALEAELVSGRLAAVIDTTEPEVLPADSPLYELPNVLLTPHIAGAMGDETERLVDCALDEIERLARGAPLEHGILRADWEHVA